MIRRLTHAVLMMLALMLLAACDGSNQDDIRKWMQDQRALVKPNVTPLAEPKRYTPQNYGMETAVSPFSIQKLTQALKRDSTQATANVALVAPELVRRKELLESYPLDSMVMVGSLIRGGQPVALVKVENLLYQVRAGNYLGQNYGKVTQISETELALREIVQDVAGEWIERTASLRLQEGKK